MKKILILILISFLPKEFIAQDRPESAEFLDPMTLLWVNNYGTFRLSEHWFWSGEFHYRREGVEGVPYVGRLAQVYNRHGITYLINKKFSATFGGVLRFDFSEDSDRKDWDHVILEPRIWHEYLFAMPFNRFMVYHRLRIEHRWNRRHDIGSEYMYRDRWRYKFYMKIPLNKTKLVPGTYYFNPDVEIIMQSGKRVIDSPLEDLRIFPGIGYIANSRTNYSVGMMYTLGQDLRAGYQFRQRWIFKINFYLSLDFRKFEDKIPEIKIRD